ncbi:MAG: copper amine oxidase N-terminal domain-containing protein [Candidatus Eremiobacteraeota bacterium]|nr:copper amine oxidase N-terminal domain-containing protein [Candidatus Eremiobacteraeota bacterium]MBV8356223.1 copper amine oxidase N-terminal domain-containing protein [Candidatus Eremiobacteraeota bacterium]
MHSLSRFAAAAAILIFAATAASAQTVQLNGQTLALNPAPVERAGRVFVPLRGVFEHMGASVVYANGLINAQAPGRSVSLHIGSTQATVNGQSQLMDVAPFIIGASTYVPLRFVAQALGAQVNWDNVNRLVAISMNNAPPAAYVPAAPPARPNRSALTLASERPRNDATVRSQRPTIEATFANGMADPNSVRVSLDGADVTSDVTRSPNGIVFSPPSDLLSQRHDVRVAGRDQNGQPFDLHWHFTSGTQSVSNFIRNLQPGNGQAVPASFTVSGQTTPNAVVDIDAGAAASLGGIISFGTDHERVETRADGNGNFAQQVNLRANSGEAATLVVTSTEPQTTSSVKETRNLQIR